MKRMGALFCLLSVTGCALSNVVPATQGHRERWLEVVTPHFVLNTDQSELQALDTAQTLEEMRAALLHMAWTGARQPPRGRIDVVVFRSLGEFNRYAGLSHPVGGVAFHRPRERRRLSFHPGPSNGIPSTIVHELAHDTASWFMPIQPVWFSEGLATFLEATTYDRSTHLAEIGGPSKRRAEWVQYSRFVLTSERLFSTSEASHDDGRATMSFYSSAWLLVHYLLNRERDRFGEFQRRLAHLEGWRHAWQSAFPGLESSELDKRLIEYALAPDAVTLTAAVELETFEPHVRTLSEAERPGVLAQLASIQQPELARREMQQALELDPNELNALRVQFHSLEADAAPERLEVAQRAVAAHPEKADAWWLLAQAHGSGREAEHALRRAYRLEPEHPGVVLQMAQDRLGRGQARSAARLARLARRRSVASSDTLSVYLQALIEARDCEGALHLQGNLEGWIAERCVDQSACETTRSELRQLVASCLHPAPPASRVGENWTLPKGRVPRQPE